MNEINLKIVFLFSGQGSQYRGMGKVLFDQNLIYRNSIEQSDAIVQKQLNRSLIDELYFIKDSQFDDLLVTHPAIVATEIATYSVLTDMGLKPDYVLGNSLGEFVSAVVSCVWQKEIAIEASIEQVKSVFTNPIPGGMLAIINCEKENIEPLYTRHHLYIASDNFDRHFTLSGELKNINAFQCEINNMGIDFFRLPVSTAFHSPLTEQSMSRFKYYMSAVPLFKPLPGFVSGMFSKEIDTLNKDYFSDVASKYYDFSSSVKYLESKGPCLYIDMGPSGTNATFVKHILGPDSLSRVVQILTPFQQELQQLKSLRKLISPGYGILT